MNYLKQVVKYSYQDFFRYYLLINYLIEFILFLLGNICILDLHVCQSFSFITIINVKVFLSKFYLCIIFLSFYRSTSSAI